MKYYHVDVFSNKPLKGNGLTVVLSEQQLSFDKMLQISQEFKQFETIFIFPKENENYPVRIFTVEEELDFAGHPIVGAASVIHKIFNNDSDEADINLLIAGRVINVKSTKSDNHFISQMNQGKATFIKTFSPNDIKDILDSLKLTSEDLDKNYPIESVSTGLPYLLLPIRSLEVLNSTSISGSNFESLLNTKSAKFIYLFNPESMECRTWDNLGAVEDIATGSAAGPLCAYLVKNKFQEREKDINIIQGSVLNRISIITGKVTKNNDVYIQGAVSFFSKGEIFNF